MKVPSRFTIRDAGTIYRAAQGWQGYYPRVVRLGERELLASLVASTQIESADSHPELARSTDGGRTWHLEGPVDADMVGQATETGFLSLAPDGTLYCLGSRWLRDPAEPERPLVHAQTLGMAPNTPVLRRSRDGGRHWSVRTELPRPYPVPLETPTGMNVLADGTLIFSCSTWREWDGRCPYGHRVTSLRSTDGGATWQGPIDLFHDPSDRLGFWEGRLAQLTDTMLVATCWAHDWQADADVHNRYAISLDAGRSWQPYAASPVLGQTGWPLRLSDDRFLFIYNHRRQPVGVRAQIAALDAGTWTTVADDEVWTPENRRVGEIVKGDYAVTHFQFGAPSAIRLSETSFLAIYWCVVDGRAGINWSLGELQ
jgi:hypothetical protein